MNLIFSIDYKTVFGEELVLNIVKDGTVAQYHLGTTDGARWTCQLTIPDTNQVLEYYYSVESLRTLTSTAQLSRTASALIRCIRFPLHHSAKPYD